MQERGVRCHVAWALGLMFALAACGDDGTEGLSSCPNGAIMSDKNGVLRCADPNKSRAGKGGGSAAGASGTKAAGAAAPAAGMAR